MISNGSGLLPGNLIASSSVVVSVVFYLCAPVNARPKQGSDRRHMGVAQGGLDVEGVVLVDITSPGHIGFVRVDNQFGNSLFCSGVAWVCFFGACMACPLCLSFFTPFCTRNWNCCLQISVGLIFAVGSLWKLIHCCIFITDIICIEEGKDV